MPEPRIGGTREALERNLRALEAQAAALVKERARAETGLAVIEELIARERAAVATYRTAERGSA